MGIEVAFIAAVVIGATASGVQIHQGQKAQGEAKKERKIARRGKELANRRAKLKAAERTRVQRARVTADAQSLGSVGQASSLSQGATGSLLTQSGEAAGFQNTLSGFNRARFRSNERQARFLRNVELAGNVASLANQAAGALSGGIGGGGAGGGAGGGGTFTQSVKSFGGPRKL